MRYWEKQWKGKLIFARHITVDEVLKPIETISYHTGLKFLAPFVITDAMQLDEESLVGRAKSFVEILSEIS